MTERKWIRVRYFPVPIPTKDTCQHCGREFEYMRKSKRRKYCGRFCAHEVQLKQMRICNEFIRNLERAANVQD